MKKILCFLMLAMFLWGCSNSCDKQYAQCTVGEESGNTLKAQENPSSGTKIK